jgi:hypothetical protein
MEFTNITEQVIKKYQEDEQIMIRLFIQWCAKHGLDAMDLYVRAYREQIGNAALKKALEEEEVDEFVEIDHETMLEVLQLFGNNDLAFVISEEIERMSKLH